MNPIFPFLIIPKNPNLHHCSDTFLTSISHLQEEKNLVIKPLVGSAKSLLDLLCLGRKIFITSSNTSLIIFLFSIEFNYILVAFYCRALNVFLKKDIKIYYFMHEPRYERGRIHPFKAFLVYWYNVYFSFYADRILIASEDALNRAKTFVKKEKIIRINLTFKSQSGPKLLNDFNTLGMLWNSTKNFSLIGRTATDKNPDGFLKMSTIAAQCFSDNSKFIRAGIDKTSIKYPNSVIHFPGYLQPVAKDFLYSLSHILIIPYKYSTQSGVISEALSYGKILIINNIPAFSHLKGLSFIFLIDFDSRESIVSCLREVFLMSKDEYRSRCLAAIKYFEENHSETYLKKNLEGIFLNLI